MTEDDQHPLVSEENYWRGQVIEARHKQLEAVQKAAKTWSELFAAILAVFGTVAFAGGLPSLEDLPGWLEWPVKLATLVAGGFMVHATISASRASGNSVDQTDENAWQDFRNAVDARADAALVELNKARRSGLIAGLIVLTGTAVIFLVGEAAAEPKPPTVIAVVDGDATCGKLTTSGANLSVDGVPLTGNVTSILVVTACP